MTMVETMNVMVNLDEEQEVDQEIQLSKELYSKHPLQNTWALWFYKNDKGKSWEANQRVITTFETVEDFISALKCKTVSVHLKNLHFFEVVETLAFHLRGEMKKQWYTLFH